MSGLFVDDLERAQADLREARKQSDVWEGRFNETATKLRLSEHRAAVSEGEQEKLRTDLEAVRRELSDARKVAESAQVARAEANEQEFRATRIEAKFVASVEALSTARTELRQAKAAIKDMQQTLDEREQQYAEAKKAIQALAQRVEADEVLSRVKLG